MDTKAKQEFTLVVLFMFMSLNAIASLVADTISANRSLSGDQIIESASGVYVLGFFKPGNSLNHYIGIWYKQVTVQTVVWVANREKPVSDRFSSELRISDGNLVLYDKSKVPIWSTNVNYTSSYPLVQAVLLDSGNLVLNNRTNQSVPLWQSFDHLTDTLLPGCKFGYNKRTKTKQILTSWKNLENPAPGLFSIEPLPSENSYVLLWNRSQVYWSAGSWDGRIFSNVPESSNHVIYDFNYVSNDNESYFIYFVQNTTKTVSRLGMDVSGQLTQPLWVPPKGWNVIWSFPRQRCQVYAVCGPYGSCTENSLPFCRCLYGFEPRLQSEWDLGDYSSGCLRRTRLQCGNKSLANDERDRFLEMKSASLPEDQRFTGAKSSTECESSCLANCSCTAYAYDSNTCSIWIGNILHLKQLPASDSSGRTLYIRLATSELPNPKKNHKGVIVVIIVGSVAGLVLVLGLIMFLVLRRRNRMTGAGQAMEGGFLVAYSYRDLQNATKHFSEMLGMGSFGSVFKGKLPDSSVIAVKKLKSICQGEKEFRAEVSIIGTIQHLNLVRLRGFCSQGTKKLLVYDYLSNGSLASHLFQQIKSNVLDWKIRYQIALGTARGLVYLHEMCRDCIIHCDIKPDNILLDEEFIPKVSDFGLAKLIGREFSRVLTTMRGTRGYLAPEWIAGVAITYKADVYSFGMVLFEIVSGRRNAEQSESNASEMYFPSKVVNVIFEGKGDVISLLDQGLEGNADMDQVERVCKVACWCIQDDEAHRPSMSQVVQMLEGNMETNLPPMPRYLQYYDAN